MSLLSQRIAQISIREPDCDQSIVIAGTRRSSSTTRGCPSETSPRSPRELEVWRSVSSLRTAWHGACGRSDSRLSPPATNCLCLLCVSTRQARYRPSWCRPISCVPVPCGSAGSPTFPSALAPPDTSGVVGADESMCAAMRPRFVSSC